MRKYTIAVTGLNAADNPCPGISVIRSLRMGFGRSARIIGVDYELLCSASYADDLIDGVYQAPFPQSDEDKYLARMAEITEKTRIDVLIPNLDFEIPVMLKLEPKLAKLGIKLLLPPESGLMLSRKENLQKLAQITDINLPRSIPFNDRRQISITASNFIYPLTVKAANGEACVAYSLEETIVFANRLSMLWGWPLIMQEHIKGDEYCVAALADRRRLFIGAVCMKKLLKSKNGTAWMGVTSKDDAVVKLSKRILDKLKWAGPVEFEFIKENDSQKYYLIEINPRFPAWIELAARSGCNLAAAAVKAALRQKVEPLLSYESGVLFSRSAIDITCDINRLGRLTINKELVYHEDKK